MSAEGANFNLDGVLNQVKSESERGGDRIPPPCGGPQPIGFKKIVSAEEIEYHPLAGVLNQLGLKK